MNDDAQLLARFAASADETAFREIVERHAPMVHGVALRRTLDRTLAEEITQTVFTILARKASSLRHGELAGWLHRTAFMESRNATRKESRRRSAIQELSMQMIEETNNSESTWAEISPHLDEAISNLEPTDRQLVVMRFFEQRSYREIADTTGKTEEASRKQLQRSVERLGGLLRKKGISLSGASLGVLLAAQTLCVPPASAAIIATGALQAASTISISVLLTNTLYTMSLSTVIKTAAIVVMIAAIPMTYMWRQQQQTDQELTALRQELAIAKLALAKPAEAEPAVSPEIKVPANAQSVAATDKKPAEDNPLGALAGLLSADGIAHIAEGESLQTMNREMNRLTTRLKLTPEQQAALKKFFEDRHNAKMIELRKIASSGILAKALKNPEGLTDEENDLMAKMDELDDPGSPKEDEAFLTTLLTGEQFAEYEKVKQEKRLAEAEEVAQSALSDINKRVDLTAEQKDKIFQAVAHKELSSQGAEKQDKGVSMSLSDFDPSHDVILKEVLTAEQFSALQKSREQEAGQMKSMMDTLLKSGAVPADAAGK